MRSQIISSANFAFGEESLGWEGEDATGLESVCSRSDPCHDCVLPRFEWLSMLEVSFSESSKLKVSEVGERGGE